MSGDAHQRQDRGFALLLVLWSMALLGLIAASFATTTRTNALIVRNAVDNAAARALADGGVMLAIYNLLDPDRQDAWRADGTIHRIDMETGQISVQVVDEGGKIDLNADTRPLLAAVLQNLGLPEPDAMALADAIADFRDPDDIPGPRGAERADYRRAGTVSLPPNRPFASVAELLDVMGMTTEVFTRIEPFVTVHSGVETINPMTAPGDLLLALTGADALAMDDFLAARGAPDSGTDDIFNIPALGEDPFAETEVLTVTIISSGTSATGARYVRQAIASLDGPSRSGGPYRLLAWSQRFD